MAAPTWPPTPEDAYAATMEEYGVSAKELGLEEDEDEAAERALLAHFLFAPPKRLGAEGAEIGLTLAEVHKRLSAWLRMIAGGDFVVGNSEPASTDGKGIFLPTNLPAPRDEWGDELLYRCMGLVQLGLVGLGFLEDRSRLSEIYRDWVVRSIYHLLAARYVIRAWSERYPGIARDFKAVRAMDKAGELRVNLTPVPREGLPGAFIPLYEGLTINLNWGDPGPEGELARRAAAAVDAAPTAEAARAVIAGHAQSLRQHFRRLRLGPPPLPYYLGVIRPEWILADLSRDLAYEQEWRQGNKPLRQLLAARLRSQGAVPVPDVGGGEQKPRGLRARLKGRLGRRGKDEPSSLADMPAYGELRDEYQDKSGGPKDVRYGAAKWSSKTRPEDILTNEVEAAPTDDGGRDYDEWDYKAGLYKVGETRVFSPEAPGGPLAGYTRIVEANPRAIKQIRKRFEALRVEERWLGGQYEGPEIDLNRAVAAVVDLAAGHQPQENFYRRFVRQRQEVCVMTLVDLSGSTQGRVIYAEQEAVILFAEGLKTLGMPHAFYGFHSTHPKECFVYRLKGFEEPYTEPVRKRLGNLRPNGATRMGAFIRHSAHILSNRPQPRRVLLMLSDGKPEDRGDYRGNYGIKDAAMAVQEARRAGIFVHCISMDPDEGAEEYLEEIFGARRYLTLDNVDLLPMRLPEVFRELVK
jgi:hypothetical protein